MVKLTFIISSVLFTIHAVAQPQTLRKNTLLWKYGNSFAEAKQLKSLVLKIDSDTLFFADFDTAFQLSGRIYGDRFEKNTTFSDGTTRKISASGKDQTKNTVWYSPSGKRIQEETITPNGTRCFEYDENGQVLFQSTVNLYSSVVSYYWTGHVDHYYSKCRHNYYEERWVDTSTTFPIYRTMIYKNDSLYNEKFEVLDFTNIYSFDCQTGNYQFTCETDSGFYSDELEGEKRSVVYSTDHGNHNYRWFADGVHTHDILTPYGREIVRWENDIRTLLVRRYHVDGKINKPLFKETRYVVYPHNDIRQTVFLYKNGGTTPSHIYHYDADSTLIHKQRNREKREWFRSKERTKKRPKKQSRISSPPAEPYHTTAQKEKPIDLFPGRKVYYYLNIAVSTPLSETPDFIYELIYFEKNGEKRSWLEVNQYPLVFEDLEMYTSYLNINKNGRLYLSEYLKKHPYLKWFDGAQLRYGQNAVLEQTDIEGNVTSKSFEDVPIQAELSLIEW